MAEKTYLVGIGASVGGLEALSQLLAHLRPDLPCAYLVLQHLSPSYRSMLAEILARETALTVREAQSGEVLQAGVVYVVPPNHNAIVKEGRLVLSVASPAVVPKPSINECFLSLAAEEGEAAIGILLSGTGSDGVAGLRAIQAAGGVTIVQKPETAKYNGMPQAAIEAGVADHVLSPEEIAARLPELLAAAQPLDLTETSTPPLFPQLLGRLREKTGFDFAGYKLGTLMRRIRRRQVATGAADLAAYLAWVEAHPEELDHLARDILISVTAFFRDREAFAVLERAVRELIQRKVAGSELRIWVAGCASGEEAYSIAMIVAEALAEREGALRVQIFATDIDEEALNVARRGLYPAAALEGVAPERLERHFRLVNRAYEVGKHLRDLVVFARHNLVSDPPFLRLDLVSCRNVLIYFDAALQGKVLQTFHFALLPDGLLFLGRSESVAQAEGLFAPVDRRERLFRKSGLAPVLPPSPVVLPRTLPVVPKRERHAETLLAAIAAHFDLAAVLCDGEGHVRYTSGCVEHYLQFPSGSVRLTLMETTLPAWRGEVLALVHRAHATGRRQQGRRRRVEGKTRRLVVEPLEGGLLLLLFLAEPQASKESDAAASADSRVLEDELVATREHLQSLVEELATANEELQSLHEEAQAANEELQATNKELEAANKELQASNEELVSLNEELNAKSQELARLNQEYAHLYDALAFPILVFDPLLQLVRYNAAAARRFALRSTAIQQPVARLKLPAVAEGLEALLGRVLAHGEREEVTVTEAGSTFRLAVTPGLDATGQVQTLIVTLIDVTELVTACEALATSEARLRALMEKTSVLFAMKDLAGNYLYANRRFLEMFGLSEADYLGKSDFMLLPPTLAADFWGQMLVALRVRGPQSAEFSFERGEERRILLVAHQPLLNEEGQPNGVIVEAEDVTALRRAEEQLRITARVFDQAGEAIMVTDPNAIIQTVNAAFTRITGYSAEEAIGKKASLLASGRHSKEFYAQMWQALRERGFWQGEIWNKRKSGESYPQWLTINRVDDEAGRPQHFVAVFSDISEIKAAQRKAEYLATHDPLTGLPNRALFHDRLRHALAQARRSNTRVALLFIDLDNFKTINDTLGHDVGDTLLKEAAERLRTAVRDVDTVARLGGDEFTAILTACNAEQADQIARRLLDDLSASFRIAERDLFVSASIGVAFYPEDGQNSVDLTRAADAAMYRAKELGRSRVEFFKPELRVRLMKRAALESALRAALATEGRLRLVFQPKFRLSNQQLVGAEALLRWHDPELGAVAPTEFIPVAEASGLIIELGRKVEELLFAQIAEWRRLGVPMLPIAWNVSPRSIREPGMADEILARLAAFGVPHDRVQVEITENALVENSKSVEANLARLHEAGVRIAIDDFGTGYSSLGYLKRLPIDELKLDKSFVDGVGTERDDETIASAVLALARALELTTVAEGIETLRQLEWLQAQGCEVGQGYYFAKPLEAAEFEDWVVRDHAR